jgi:hypothetical protein
MCIAFCFLAYNDIDHPALWTEFFAGADSSADYTIWLHSKHGLRQSQSQRQSQHQSQVGAEVSVVATIPTEWGTWSLVEAQQRLMEQACEANDQTRKIILLSSDAVPLYNFKTIQERLLADDMAWLDVRMTTESAKRKKIAFGPAQIRQTAMGSQWLVLTREQVLTLGGIVRASQADARSKFVADERIWQTIFTSRGLPFHRVSPTHVEWNRRSGRCINNAAATHRESPYTYCRLHASDIAAARSAGALFIRKICPSADVSGLNLK